MHRIQTLLMIDFDGTLWKINPLRQVFSDDLERFMGKHGVKVRIDNLYDIQYELLQTGEYRVKGNLQLMLKKYYEYFIYPQLMSYEVTFEKFYEFITTHFNKRIKRLRFRKHAIQTLKHYHNLSNVKITGVTNGSYDYEVTILNKKLGHYSEIIDDWFTPEKLKTKYGLDNPYKPNTEIINRIIRTYNADYVIIIGDNLKTDGLLAESEQVIKTLIITDKKSLMGTLRNIKYKQPTPEEIQRIKNLYLEGDIELVPSWKVVKKKIEELIG